MANSRGNNVRMMDRAEQPVRAIHAGTAPGPDAGADGWRQRSRSVSCSCSTISTTRSRRRTT